MSDQKLIIGYYRLSMEDDSEGESNSIINQRKLVKDYISNIPELASMPFQEFYDDGYSGSSMERPAIKQVLELARENKVQCIVVKDFSRFARNYIEMGTYLEQIFPFLGVRFISISDRYDSKDYKGKSSDIEVQFKGLIADFYVKDQSVKVKSAVSTRRGKGEYCCGSAPYGYRINPENKKELVIVEDEAEVIRRVFELTNQRYSKMEICKLFNEEGVLTPLQSMSRRQKSDSKKAASRGLQWTSDMIRKIVDDKTYIGCMVYGKTKIPDPGTGKEVPVPRNQWKVMENHHEPIVSKEIFEKAQSLQIRYAKKSKFDRETTLLGGYVKCGNCRRSLTSSSPVHGHILYSCAYSKGKEDTGCFAGKADNKMLEHIVLQLEKERGLDRNAAIADMRFSFIEKVCRQTVVKPKESKEHIRSQKIDRILTGKYTAIPCFVGIMVAVFYLTFNVIGAYLQDLLALGIDALTKVTDHVLTAANVNPAIHGLVIDGIFSGVGSVLSFLPVIVTLFFFLSLMEDSGYIARVAFFMDKLLRKIGLSGRSIVPMLIGFGCTVPAVMSTRTLPSERDRKMTILLTPFMSCSAKLPIYAFFVNAFFPGRGGLIMAGLYILGIVMGILIALFYKGTLFKGEAVPFVMELPNYRLPGFKNVSQLLWEKAKDFLQRAFSVILVATVVVWFLQSFDLHLNMVTDSQNSILATIAGMIAPLFQPLGLGDWRICTSLISGFMAKESVVSTLEILFAGNVNTALSTLSAASLLVFSLLYTPCVAAIASIKRELGQRWAIGVVVWQCVIAWLAAFAVHLIGSFL